MAAYSQLHTQQFELAAALAGCGGSNYIMFPKMVVQPAVFSEPESELTCNLSGSRKRARDEPPSQMSPSNVALYLQQEQMQRQLLRFRNPIYCKTTHAVASGLPVESSRCAQSAMTSTSGRPPLAAAAAAAADPSPVTPLRNHRKSDGSAGCSSSSTSSGLISMLHCSDLEVDALVRLHADKLRSGLGEARKSQCHAVVEAMGRQVWRRIADKQVELDAAAKMNIELEERLREAAAESQSWFNVAKNSEALVARLRTSLEQALLQNHSCRGTSNGGNCAPGLDLLRAAAEGYGDSEEEAGAAAVSCSERCLEASYSVVGVAKNAASAGERSCFPCKSCGEPDASVLVLPCRHLCLCARCEPSVDECPICRGRKNASIQISFF